MVRTGGSRELLERPSAHAFRPRRLHDDILSGEVLINGFLCFLLQLWVVPEKKHPLKGFMLARSIPNPKLTETLTCSAGTGPQFPAHRCLLASKQPSGQWTNETSPESEQEVESEYVLMTE